MQQLKTNKKHFVQHIEHKQQKKITVFYFIQNAPVFYFIQNASVFYFIQHAAVFYFIQHTPVFYFSQNAPATFQYRRIYNNKCSTSTFKKKKKKTPKSRQKKIMSAIYC